MVAFLGILLHALLFAVLLGVTELEWYWCALISGLIVWLGILVITEDMFG